MVIVVSATVARTPARDGDPDRVGSNGETALITAAARDDIGAIQQLLDDGADPDAPGIESITPLHAASQMGAVAAIERLLSAGADPELRSTNGMNALHHAAAVGQVDSIRRLVTAGLDVDEASGVRTEGNGYPADSGPSALAIAARAGHESAIQALLDLGATADAESSMGITPLLAAVFGDAPVALVDSLLAAGADPTIEVACSSGCSRSIGTLDAIGWAEHLDRAELLPTLRDAASR